LKTDGGPDDTQDSSTAQQATLAVAVWDLPIRLFHWGLVALIAFSWWSAEYGHTQWHIWSGYLALFAVLFRLGWGLVGSSTARFAGFVRGPRAVMNYLSRSREWSAIGHTPVGALSVLALLGLIGAQIAFGLVLVDEDGEFSGPLAHLVGDETSEFARSVHLWLFNVLLGFIGLHVAAILFYRVVQGKDLVGPMIGGSSRQGAPGGEGLAAARPGRLWLCLGVAAALTAWVAAGLPPF
jgi:cytochrome b